MSLATHSNLNRVQLLHSLLTFVILGLVLWPCNAHYNYYNKTNGKGRMSSMGHVKGYGKGRGGGGGGGSSNVHVMQSKGHRNTTSTNGSATMSDEPTTPPSKITMTGEPTAPPSKVTMTDNPTAPPSKVTTAENPTALPSKKTVTDDPTAPPSKATIMDKPTAPPSKITMTDKPTAPPSKVTMTDEPSAKPSQPIITDKPSAKPSQPIITDKPTAPPTEAACIVSPLTDAKVCLLFDTSTNFYFDNAYDNKGVLKKFAQHIVSEINTTSPETKYILVSFGSYFASNSDFYNADNAYSDILGVKFQGGVSNPQFGLTGCQDSFDMNDGKEHIIIIFTNGQAANQTEVDIVTTKIKDTGTKIVCVGIGLYTDFTTLERWSTTPNLTFQTRQYLEDGLVTDGFTKKISCA